LGFTAAGVFILVVSCFGGTVGSCFNFVVSCTALITVEGLMFAAPGFVIMGLVLKLSVPVFAGGGVTVFVPLFLTALSPAGVALA
jgi:hypothetical protein